MRNLVGITVIFAAVLASCSSTGTAGQATTTSSSTTTLPTSPPTTGVSKVSAAASTVMTSSTTTTTVSTSVVYQNYISSELFPYPPPATLLATPLPVGDYVVQIAIGIAPTHGTVDVSCNLQTTVKTDMVTANTGGAQDTVTPDQPEPAGATVAIDGTVTVTQAHDQVEVTCGYSGVRPTLANGSLIAEPVDKIKG